MPRLSPSASSESVTLTASLGHCLRPGLSLICAHAHAHTLRHTHMPTPLSWPEAYLQRPGERGITWAGLQLHLVQQGHRDCFLFSKATTVQARFHR